MTIKTIANLVANGRKMFVDRKLDERYNRVATRAIREAVEGAESVSRQRGTLD